MSPRLFTIIAIFLVSLNPLASNAQSTAMAARWYKISWNNIYIADFKVELDDKSMASSIQSRGAIRKISKYTNESSTKFAKTSKTYLPIYHHSYLTQRQGNKEVTINYAKGRIKTESLSPPDKPGKRPAVSPENKATAVDPLTAAVIARDKIRAAITNGEKEFSFNIYDGRRLSKINFNIIGQQTIKILDKNQDVVKITFRRDALEGFTNNELRRLKGEDPNIDVYLGKDDLLPVYAEAAAPLGKAIFTLVKECESIVKCK